VIGLVALQFAGGVVNILLGTPVWLSLFHLLLADALWISWVWMAAELLQDEGMVPPPDTLTSTGDGTQPRGSLQ
jgi:heme A synthase